MDATQATIDTTTHAELVQCLSEKLRANYVFPDVAEEICARLQRHLDDGAYTGITEGEFLAFALTQHMQEVNGDEHLLTTPLPCSRVLESEAFSVISARPIPH